MLSPLPQPPPIVGTRKLPFLSVSRGAGEEGQTLGACQSLRLPDTNVLVREGACACFPLPNGHVHLLGPDSVLEGCKQ